MRAYFFMSAGVLALAACTNGPIDLDMRDLGKGFDTTTAAQAQTAPRPTPDNRGVISYPTYQAVVARDGDTVGTIAVRLGLSSEELARYNGLPVNAPLNAGEVLVLPRRVSATAGQTSATSTDRVDVETLASGAIARAAPAVKTSGTTTSASSGSEPLRHKVVAGETAYSIARLYGVSTKSLAEWNGLGPNMEVRSGQYLLIPVVVSPAPSANTTTAPGVGSPTPTPPSAATPLPAEKTQPVSKTEAGAVPGTPPSPDLAKERTAASKSRMTTPVQGTVIRDFGGKNDGIDIAVPAGTTVVAADGGVVAAITRDTDQVPILVLRHDGGLLTVYANVDDLKVQKGQTVSRGQPIASVRNAPTPFLHFEVREGIDARDPAIFID
ncbi:LysM peptidoglycan-binding domain-containing protein [Tropicimonas sp. IMCC34043]|uniref:LysM peptidoglycan-binding domain-containing protein n=1 Tax=Tropicimonas sp. IMCC34043 TaxID=2248760 RepID=UPI001E34B0AE|nr:LysM peptidoglycan-binding domain-containing protein [Tropicimonas sp. IMCC34043]